MLLSCGVGLAAWGAGAEATAQGMDGGEEMSSLSIVGYDPDTGEVGVALASYFFAVGPIATHVRVGAGAVATMGGAPHGEGSLVLDWLEEGMSPAEALDRLRERHPEGIGQLNIVDARGRSLSTTSPTQASQWRGHRYGQHYAAAGNILTGPEVVDAFAESFEGTAGLGLPLAERLLAALEAADRAGGDARGRMGAALLVHKEGAGYQGQNDYVNLRVDDSAHAIQDLRKLYTTWKGVREEIPGYRTLEQSRGRDVRWLQCTLGELGYLDRGNRSVFAADGEAIGLFNNVTADAVAEYKRGRGLGGSPSAGLETVNAIRRDLDGRSTGCEER